MFQRELLSAHDVCSNCFGQRRREAVRETKWDGEQHYYERTGRLTTEYVPDVPVTQARSVYCRCGADSAFTRIWDDAHILAHRERFHGLVRNLIHTLEAKGYRVDRKCLAGHALAALDDVPHPEMCGPFQEGRPLTVNDALAAGVEAGVQPTPEGGERASA